MQEVTKINSINCPVCGNLCSTQAVACPKCGHPLNAEKEKSANVSTSQPFIIIFKIIAYLSAAVAGWNALIIVLKPFIEGYESRNGEPGKNILYFIVSIISYAFFSYLISQAKKK